MLGAGTRYTGARRSEGLPAGVRTTGSAKAPPERPGNGEVGSGALVLPSVAL